MNRINAFWSIALVASIMIIGYLTLSPGQGKKDINLIPFKDNAVFIREFFAHDDMRQQDIPRWVFLNLFGNLLLFMPFGCSLAGYLAHSSSHPSYLVVILFGCLLSMGIELFQLL